MYDSDRGTGRTSRQIAEAPRDAVFVWCNDRTGYAAGLARHLGRPDLRIVSASYLRNGGERLCGLRQPIILDHALVSLPEYAAGVRTVEIFNAAAKRDAVAS